MFRQGLISCCWPEECEHICVGGLRCIAGILSKGLIRSMTGRSLVGDQLGSWQFHNRQNGENMRWKEERRSVRRKTISTA